MKKLVLILLVVCLTLGTLGACKKDDVKPPADNVIQIDTTDKISDLVANGKTDYVIVTNNICSDTEYFAATEMSNFVKEITGVSVPVISEIAIDYSDDAKIISVGETDVLEDAIGTIDKTELKEDGFIVKTAGKSLFIVGANDRGTLYGVYDYLEKAFGVKFLSEDYTYVPKNNTLTVYKTEIKEIPAFNIRILLTGMLYEDSLFLARMRMGSEMTPASDRYGGKVKWNTTAPHTTLYYVPTSVYYTAANRDENAHMYYTDDNGTPLDICMSDGITEDENGNPMIDESMKLSAIKVAIENLKERVLDADEECTNFIFSQMDTTKYCTCERCVRNAEKYKRSGIMIRFTNILSREINKWAENELNGREINLITFAYNYTTDAPIDKEGNVLHSSCKPDENVFIRIAPIGANYYYSFESSKNQALGNTIKNWGKITKNIMIWSYETNYSGFLTYFPTMHICKENLKLYRDLGAEYVLMQSDHKNFYDWQDRIDCYVTSKMLWNPDRDVTELQEEFVNLYYGPAASEVKEVISLLDEKTLEISEEPGIYFNIYNKNLMKTDYYPLEFVNNLISILDDGIKKINDSGLSEEEKTAFIKRVKGVKLTPLYVTVSNASAYYSTDSQKRLEIVKEFVETCEYVNFTMLNESEAVSDLRAKYGI